MADFDTLESSVEESRPIEIYSFALGSQEYLYTSIEETVTYSGSDYAPEAIKRGSTSMSREDQNRTLDIECPATNVFARKYLDVVPGNRASVSIIRLQRDESPTFDTASLIWKGFVQSVQFPGNGQKAMIQTKSIESALSRTIPQWVYSGVCNHILYSSGCGAVASSFKYTGEVTAVSDVTITVSGASGYADGYFNGGYISPTGSYDRRLILDHTGDVLTMLLPFHASPLGSNVDVYPGCDHIIDGHCDTRYSRVATNGGYTFVPTKNPFEKGLT
jgi:hypothetical protein